MTGVDWGWVLGVAIVLWPVAYCALYAIRQAGRALTHTIRTHARRKP